MYLNKRGLDGKLLSVIQAIMDHSCKVETCKCKCGAIEADIPLFQAWGGFICHCSMCPDKTYHDEKIGSGMAFIAVPKFQYKLSSVSSILTKKTSNFAQRSRCNTCNSPLTMQYDCEPHTTWISLDFAVSFNESQTVKTSLFNTLPMKAHIHCSHLKKGELDKGDDGIVAYPTWEPWLNNQDPCKPKEVPPLEICLECFLPKIKSNNDNIYGNMTKSCKCNG